MSGSFACFSSGAALLLLVLVAIAAVTAAYLAVNGAVSRVASRASGVEAGGLVRVDHARVLRVGGVALMGLYATAIDSRVVIDCVYLEYPNGSLVAVFEPPGALHSSLVEVQGSSSSRGAWATYRRGVG